MWPQVIVTWWSKSVILDIAFWRNLTVLTRLIQWDHLQDLFFHQLSINVDPSRSWNAPNGPKGPKFKQNQTKPKINVVCRTRRIEAGDPMTFRPSWFKSQTKMTIWVILVDQMTFRKVTCQNFNLGHQQWIKSTLFAVKWRHMALLIETRSFIAS